jgi:hypothetical protein
MVIVMPIATTGTELPSWRGRLVKVSFHRTRHAVLRIVPNGSVDGCCFRQTQPHRHSTIPEEAIPSSIFTLDLLDDPGPPYYRIEGINTSHIDLL